MVCFEQVHAILMGLDNSLVLSNLLFKACHQYLVSFELCMRHVSCLCELVKLLTSCSMRLFELSHASSICGYGGLVLVNLTLQIAYNFVIVVQILGFLGSFQACQLLLETSYCGQKYLLRALH